MKQLTFIASLMTMLAAPLFSQNDSSTVLRNPLDNLIVRSVVKQSIFPEERVYLHFDNNAYYLGETMWFKAYVTSGTDDTPTTMSRVLYVELVAPEGYVVKTNKYKIDDAGCCHGEFELNRLLLSGYYEVRAYTRYILNRGKDAIFSRVFPVFDEVKNGDRTFRNMLDRKRAFLVDVEKDSTITGLDREVAWENGTLPECDVKFYPEGGHLVEGIESRVAYEVFGNDGINSSRSITILADSEELLTTTPEHNGVGTFSIKPKEDTKYTALLKRGKKSEKFHLPKAEKEGAVIEIENNGGTVCIAVKNNLATDTELGLAVLHRGKTNYYERFPASERNMLFAIDKSTLPEGVNRVVLFVDDAIPYAERLFFVTHDEIGDYSRSTAKLVVKNSNTTPQPHEKIKLRIEREDGKPITDGGSFSLSVTDGCDNVTTSYNYNLYTYLLLGSEIKGYIPNAAQYFDTRNKNRARELDLIMLTRGWTSYDWSKLSNKTADLDEPVEKGITIKGRFIKKRPNRKFGKLDRYNIANMADCKVKFEITYRDSNITAYDFRTDANGEFYLQTKDFTGKKVAKLTPRNNSISSKDSIFTFNLQRYFSPTMRLYEYWERNTGLPATEEELAREKEMIIKINPFEYLLTQVEVVSKQKHPKKYRPPRSEMRLDFLDEWEYAQDVTYLTNKKYVHSPGYTKPHLNNSTYDGPPVDSPISLHAFSVNRGEHVGAGSTHHSFHDDYDTRSAFDRSVTNNDYAPIIHSVTNNDLPYSEVYIADPAYEGTLTSADVLRSAFWRHNFNWCYWIQSIVVDEEYNPDSIPRRDEEYTKGVNIRKMLNFKEFIIRSDEKTRRAHIEDRRPGGDNEKRIKTYNYDNFYNSFENKMGIAPRNWDIDDAPDATIFTHRVNESGGDELPNYVACFIPYNEQEEAAGIIPMLTRRSSARYTMVYGYTESKQFYAPDYSKMQPDGNATPDYRRTLLWVPQATSRNGNIEVELYNNAVANEISVSVEGYADGTFYSTDSITVTRENKRKKEQMAIARQEVLTINGIDKPELLAHCFIKNEEGRAHYRDKDYQKAFELFNEAASLGYPDALFNRAVCLMLGHGTTKDSIEAFRQFRTAANMGNKQALHNLAGCYMHGVGTYKNDSLAIACYTLSASNGYAPSQTILADCYLRGTGVEKDSTTAYHWFGKAAEQNEPIALFTLAERHAREDSIAALSKRKLRKQPTIDYYTRAANVGHSKAQFKLAQFYDNGTYVRKSRKKAFYWYLAAAKKGHPVAIEHVAYCYEKGRGTKKNQISALHWYKLAEKQGSELAEQKMRWYNTFRFFE